MMIRTLKFSSAFINTLYTRLKPRLNKEGTLCFGDGSARHAQLRRGVNGELASLSLVSPHR